MTSLYQQTILATTVFPSTLSSRWRNWQCKGYCCVLDNMETPPDTGVGITDMEKADDLYFSPLCIIRFCVWRCRFNRQLRHTGPRTSFIIITNRFGLCCASAQALAHMFLERVAGGKSGNKNSWLEEGARCLGK